MDDKQKTKIGYSLMAIGFIILLIVPLASGSKEEEIMDAFFSTLLWIIPIEIVAICFLEDTDSAKRRIEDEYRAESVGNCPHCGSYKTYKLSTVGKVISTAALGLASSTIGKQYGCHKCGHKW